MLLSKIVTICAEEFSVENPALYALIAEGMFYTECFLYADANISAFLEFLERKV